MMLEAALKWSGRSGRINRPWGFLVYPARSAARSSLSRHYQDAPSSWLDYNSFPLFSIQNVTFLDTSLVMHQFSDTLLSINPDISGVSYMDVLGSPLCYNELHQGKVQQVISRQVCGKR